MACLAESRRRAALQLEVGKKKFLDDSGRWGKAFLLLLLRQRPKNRGFGWQPISPSLDRHRLSRIWTPKSGKT
jgi:hypothetical protein